MGNRLLNYSQVKACSKAGKGFLPANKNGNMQNDRPYTTKAQKQDKHALIKPVLTLHFDFISREIAAKYNFTTFPGIPVLRLGSSFPTPRPKTTASSATDM